jgi:hypothetical protein
MLLVVDRPLLNENFKSSKYTGLKVLMFGNENHMLSDGIPNDCLTIQLSIQVGL